MNEGYLLVVTDDSHLARLLAADLAEAGFRDVVVCSTGDEALACAEERRPRLLLADVNMGGIDGFQLCRILSAPPRPEDRVPVVLFSASFRDGRATRLAEDAGAFAFLENARDVDRLVSTVGEATAVDAGEVAATIRRARPRALVLDADVVSRESVAEALGPDGFQVDAAADPEVARNEIRESELVLVEKSVPGIGGVPFLEWIQRERPEIPVVVLGGKGDSSRELLAAGADDFLQKPLRPADVRAVCRRAIARREYKRTSAHIESSERRLRSSEERFRRLQRRLVQSQKIESLGALAGGMAHDFNNILATILPHAEIIRSLSSDEDVSRRARAIEEAARRGGELTRRLLAFARPQGEHGSHADVNASVESTIVILRETFDRKIRVESDLMNESALVPVERSQLEHVLLNLGLNARDAMVDGGELRFRTEMSRSRGRSLVSISVEDTGCGMSREVVSRIFEPFFTTKEEGKGTGLGLSTAYSIVQAVGGFIDVESLPGLGSKFRILLPARLYRPMPTFEARKPVRGKRERVLVVDDEESVRELTAEMLGRLNYEVSSVSSGREAIEYCRRSSRLDLVVLDMIMPDMDGRTTYQRILEVRPDLRFVLASGDLDNPQAGELASKGIEILQKPFSLVHLSTKVSSALSSGRGRGIEPTV